MSSRLLENEEHRSRLVAASNSSEIRVKRTRVSFLIISTSHFLISHQSFALFPIEAHLNPLRARSLSPARTLHHLPLLVSALHLYLVRVKGLPPRIHSQCTFKSLSHTAPYQQLRPLFILRAILPAFFKTFSCLLPPALRSNLFRRQRSHFSRHSPSMSTDRTHQHTPK